MARCLARITYENTRQQFPDRKHYYYLEYQCEYIALPEKKVCEKCVTKNEKERRQSSRKFDHGCIGEEIPPKSHIKGGKWYQEAVKKWGEPFDLGSEKLTEKEVEKVSCCTKFFSLLAPAFLKRYIQLLEPSA